MPNTQVDASRQVKDASVTDAKLASTFTKANGTVPFTANQSLGGFRLTNVADAVADSDYSSWGQVKQAIRNVLYRRLARAAATGNVSVSNPGTAVFDGVTLANGDILFLPSQTTQAENGLYTFNGSASALTRAVDADNSTEVQPGLAVFVSEGTTLGNSRWNLITDGPITLGTTALTFSQETTGGTYIAGNGLQLVTATFSVVPVASSGITVSGAGVGIDASIIQRKADIIVRETPSGTVNGSNTAFALANTPVVGSEQVYLNGVLQEPGAGNDYTISGANITFITAPVTGDRIRVSYLK
ncbi:MAG: hypothetical protein IVW51_15380 [Thermaceae bacterium]|nr:hypothetical protein [Thermaceae bacterium]